MNQYLAWDLQQRLDVHAQLRLPAMCCTAQGAIATPCLPRVPEHLLGLVFVQRASQVALCAQLHGHEQIPWSIQAPAIQASMADCQEIRAACHELAAFMLVSCGTVAGLCCRSTDSRCTKAHDMVMLALAQQRNLLSETLLHRRTASAYPPLAVHIQEPALLARTLRADVGYHTFIGVAPLHWGDR
jgi:hypothetical protein